MLYFVNHHQTAKATVPTTAVMAVEINNESAASLIQSVTVISSRLNHRVPARTTNFKCVSRVIW
jgi:hypothetical protein